ncbi:unnamed protein product [marine sediment metagenome]|uniref:Uncharacterized protein n=1 Tax=marine sediment metagenome TaxID=412755 RepID=X0SQ38_9ZZZZ
MISQAELENHPVEAALKNIGWQWISKTIIPGQKKMRWVGRSHRFDRFDTVKQYGMHIEHDGGFIRSVALKAFDGG